MEVKGFITLDQGYRTQLTILGSFENTNLNLKREFIKTRMLRETLELVFMLVYENSFFLK